MTKKRIEFSPQIKEIISKRAGFKCSFPNCNKTLIGPGVNNDQTINIGECAHIFSAAENGPRTDGGLDEIELKRPENGIYLCRTHHKIVDRKAKDNKYTSDLLTRYKTRHEFQISAELGEYMYPFNWINKIKISGTNLENVLSINLGKVTLLTGSNGTGKSTVIEILDSTFEQRILPRWNKPDIKFSTEIKIDNPVLSKFTSKIRHNYLHYSINDLVQPFVPYDFFVLNLSDTNEKAEDDLKYIASHFGKDRAFLKSMLLTTGIKHGLRTKSIELKEKRKIPYPVEKLYVDIGNNRTQSFKSCSSTEQNSVILDIAISIATEVAKFKSVLFLVDWTKTNNFSDGNIEKYLNYLQSSNAHFQTVFASHNERPNLDWSGWAIAKFIKEEENIMVIQNEK